MSNAPAIKAAPQGSSRKARPAWWLVFSREMTDLWMGGKALNLVLVFSVLLGGVAFVLATNSELSLIPPKEMVFEMLRLSLAAAGFICLIIGADSLSGERERSTLEGLLLTPVSRRQIVVGKFLAAVSPWPAALVLSLPYWALLSQGDEAFGLGALWGSILGSLLVPALAAIGMLVSSRSNTNRTSMFVSLGIYLLILVPTQLPGSAQAGSAGQLLKKVSPMEATYHFLEKIIVNSRTVGELTAFLIAPAALAVLAIGTLLFYSPPRLGLEAGGSGKRPSRGGSVAAALLAVMLLTVAQAAPATAQETQDALIGISIDMDVATVKTGDPVLFDTSVTNDSDTESPPLIVAMNIINLDSEGDVVDPEDWSPERTQYVTPMAAGESVRLSWRVNAILEGDYMVYMVVVPEPDGTDATSHPVASPGIHLTVDPFTRLNPGGVLPLVIAIPTLLMAAVGFVMWRQRRRINQVDTE
ncbi:MAG TPA: ABC transporter permease subunit [Acidimicrobiia bacterium]|nr:ABC transporter permease subunit [Acidimicrobiia bacterium]